MVIRIKEILIFTFITVTVTIIISNCSPSKTEKKCSYTQIAPKNTIADFITINYENNTCVSCHQNIDPIRDPHSGMMQEIYKVAEKAGFRDNDCIVCHGGNPEVFNKKATRIRIEVFWAFM